MVLRASREAAVAESVGTTTPDEEQLARDIDTVARHALWRAADDICADGWDLYPDLGLYDWEAVQRRVTELASYPDYEAYLAAYERLAARAEQS